MSEAEKSFLNISDGFWEEMTKQLDKAGDEAGKKQAALGITSMLGTVHFRDMMDTITRMTNLDAEIIRTIRDMEGTLFHTGFVEGRIASIEQMVLAIKYYVIAWSTMMDLIASLVNEVFDLGIADRDVRLHSVLRNKHVASSTVGVVIPRYVESNDQKDFAHHRNVIIHRGDIEDKEVVALRREMNVLIGNQYSIFGDSKLPEEKYQAKFKELQERVTKLAKDKKVEYSAHYDRFKVSLKEIMSAFGKVTFEGAHQHKRSSVDLKDEE